MNKIFHEVSDVIADERFLAWYFKDDPLAAAEWEQLLEVDPDLQGLAADAAAFLKTLPAREVPLSRQQVEQSLEKLKTRLGQAPVVSIKRKTRWWAVAAAAAVLFAAGLFFTYNLNNKSDIEAAYGQLCTNELPDGSTLILNANSKVSLSKDWKGGNDREVWLEGEAFFKVAKTAEKRRFIVHTSNLDVIVTGTEFNVSNRNNHTSVLLTEGSVILKMKDGRELLMKPGDFIEMNESQLARKPVNEENVLAWKDNRMAFDNTSIEEVATIISNHYGVKVVLGDEAVKQQSISGIMKNNNLDELLRAIGMTDLVSITQTKEQITISSNIP